MRKARYPSPFKSLIIGVAMGTSNPVDPRVSWSWMNIWTSLP
ncbi:MAG: hypothetical protein ACP5LZ_07260 [Fervidicoccaceae archaeon]